MRSAELRQRYIDFFVERGHLHLPGAPLIPIDALGVEDRSTLFTSAGMQQFKPYFTGEAVPPSPRVVTVQKCVRTGDIESVGDTSHCTFFEMLGNFSFGDYFKAEVIPWTWEFVTEAVRLDGDRLCATVYRDDDEAFAVWRDVVGLPEDRIHRLGAEKNFWPPNAITDGPNGPCGPCTEVFYQVAEPHEMADAAGLSPTERYLIDDAAGRWLEVWNNVFTQFERSVDASGTPCLQPLPNRNNDTGAGFERIVCLLQGVHSVFDSDLFESVVRRVGDLAGIAYNGSDSPQDVAFRVVAEHARTMVFCIADGVLPSSEGRGYVLRRVMRRAVRYGMSRLRLDRPFLHEVAPAVIDAMAEQHPELRSREEHILRSVAAEEERFRRVLADGFQRIEETLSDPDVQASRRIPGAQAFVLYDTYGFPVELTREIAAERNFEVDLAGFEEAREAQRTRSREASSLARDLFTRMGEALSEIQRTCPPTTFAGYDGATRGTTRVIAIVRGGELVNFARTGDEAEVVLESSPFYAEAGGQVGDTGWIEADGLRAEVRDTQKPAGVHLHRVLVVEGELTTQQWVVARIDEGRRRDIMRNHTATHLLHAALREVLGDHVHQAGSLVAPDRLRFDFTHTGGLSADEVRLVEERVNAAALADLPVDVSDGVPISEAGARGAIALFGEKYGDTVRVVEVPGHSVELCGGTHLERSSQIGLLKVLGETSIASGVRRIEAVTGYGTYKWMREHEDILREVSAALHAPSRDVVAAAERMADTVAALEREVRRLRSASAREGFSPAHDAVGPIDLYHGFVDGADAPALGALADQIASRHTGGAVVLASSCDGRAYFVAKAPADAVAAGFHAGELLRGIAKLAGGGGGGRPDFAQAGGRDGSQAPRAAEAIVAHVRRQVGA
ncbi:MAG TPA: alanine--tRNA ligase [Chthonomonadales bacterium]|nr:alanine--tRNA ligase [Chthonomonadales bacterium]